MSKSWKLPQGNYIDSSSIVMDNIGSTLDNFLPENYKKIKNCIELQPNTDLNTLSPGSYISKNTSITSTLLNHPKYIGGGFRLEVFEYDSNNLSQVITYENTNIMATRRKTSSSWGQWKVVGGEQIFGTTSKAVSGNISANGVSSFTAVSEISSTNSSDWYPIGIQSIETNHTTIGGLNAFKFTPALNKATAQVWIRNNSGSQQSYTITVKFIWVRSNLRT